LAEDAVRSESVERFRERVHALVARPALPGWYEQFRDRDKFERLVARDPSRLRFGELRGVLGLSPRLWLWYLPYALAHMASMGHGYDEYVCQAVGLASPQCNGWQLQELDLEAEALEAFVAVLLAWVGTLEVHEPKYIYVEPRFRFAYVVEATGRDELLYYLMDSVCPAELQNPLRYALREWVSGPGSPERSAHLLDLCARSLVMPGDSHLQAYLPYGRMYLSDEVSQVARDRGGLREHQEAALRAWDRAGLSDYYRRKVCGLLGLD
jgi:hypothetical protein